MTGTCVQQLTQSDFQREVLDDPGVVLVDFFGRHCPPCAAASPVLETLCKRRGDEFKIVKIDAETNIDLSVRLKIMAMPTFILYQNGQPIARTQGFASPSQFEQWIDDSLGVNS